VLSFLCTKISTIMAKGNNSKSFILLVLLWYACCFFVNVDEYKSKAVYLHVWCVLITVEDVDTLQHEYHNYINFIASGLSSCSNKSGGNFNKTILHIKLYTI